MLFCSFLVSVFVYSAYYVFTIYYFNCSKEGTGFGVEKSGRACRCRGCIRARIPLVCLAVGK